jgi:5-methyltetrahydrofolate--homocysteine methyltransferase
MIQTSRGPFLVIGENIHATRVLRRGGPALSSLADGSPALRFSDEDGAERLLPVPAAAIDGSGERAKVRHVKAAVLAGLGGAADGELGRGYVRSLARRQAAAGADWLDCNVDEVSTDLDGRIAAIRWLVGAVEDATPLPLSLDSSSTDVLRAGLAAARRPAGPPLLNSAGLDRLDVLDLAAREGCPAVLAATGTAGMPASAAERVVNARAIVDAALARDMTEGSLHVDPLVLPVAVDPAHGAAFLEAVLEMRADFGPRIHVTGGLSNVSFGLPERRLLNDVFIDLAVGAGADCGIIDPIANDPGTAVGQDPERRGYRLAAALLTGADPYGAAFLAAFRAGELA